MVQTRSALILFLGMVAHKAACHASTLSKAFLKSIKIWYRSADFEVLFTQDSEAEYLFCSAFSSPEPSLFFSNYLSGMRF